jgi:hypothetical protein
MGNPVTFLKGIYATSEAGNCSGFLKKVAKELGILGPNKAIPEDRANQIIEYIGSHSDVWKYIGKGETDGVKAANEAGKGYLVVAVLKGSEHTDHREAGHVAIILPPPTLDKYPYIICSGGKWGTSDGSKAVYTPKVGGVWTQDDAVNVKYYETTTTFPELTADGAN